MAADEKTVYAARSIVQDAWTYFTRHCPDPQAYYGEYVNLHDGDQVERVWDEIQHIIWGK